MLQLYNIGHEHMPFSLVLHIRFFDAFLPSRGPFFRMYRYFIENTVTAKIYRYKGLTHKNQQNEYISFTDTMLKDLGQVAVESGMLLCAWHFLVIFCQQGNSMLCLQQAVKNLSFLLFFCFITVILAYLTSFLSLRPPEYGLIMAVI